LIDCLNAHYAGFAGRHKLKLIHSEYDPRHFGHSVVMFDGERIRVRLTCGRDPLYVDLATAMEPDKWWSLSCVHKAVFGANPPIDSRAILNLNLTGRETDLALLHGYLPLLDAHLEAYAKALGPESEAFKRSLEKVRAEEIEVRAEWTRKFLAKQSKVQRVGWLRKLLRLR
jgi:hypothetical protein